MSKPDFSRLPQHRYSEGPGEGNPVHYLIGDTYAACGANALDFGELSGTVADPDDCPRCLELATRLGQATLTQQRVLKETP